MVEPRIILMERVEDRGQYSQEWWNEVIGGSSKTKANVIYRKRGTKVFDIKNIIEIPNNPKECMVLFYDGEEIVVQGSFPEVYEKWIDASELEDDEY